MNSQVIVTFISVIFFALNLYGQEKPVTYNLSELSKNKKLQVHNREVSAISENGKSGIRLSRKEKDGVAWIEGATFLDGVIELDIKGKDVLQQSFVGLAFHGADDKNFDVVYFRPFNFRAEDSVRRIHAVQYVSLPDYDWQRLRQEQNGKFENAITPAVNPNEWFHVNIVVQYPQVKVYVNGESQSTLQVQQLSKRKSGKLGLWVGNESGGDFADLSVTHAKSQAD